MNMPTFTGAKFQGLPETQKITGLSRAALYRGVKAGVFPHIKSGKRILFNIPMLLEVLDGQSINEERF